MQGGSCKIKKFLHIDESIAGNLITIKGQNLLVLPSRINTEMPAGNTGCDQDEIMGSIEDFFFFFFLTCFPNLLPSLG